MMPRKFQGKDMRNQPDFFIIHCIFLRAWEGERFQEYFCAVKLQGWSLLRVVMAAVNEHWLLLPLTILKIVIADE